MLVIDDCDEKKVLTPKRLQQLPIKSLTFDLWSS